MNRWVSESVCSFLSMVLKSFHAMNTDLRTRSGAAGGGEDVRPPWGLVSPSKTEKCLPPHCRWAFIPHGSSESSKLSNKKIGDFLGGLKRSLSMHSSIKKGIKFIIYFTFGKIYFPKSLAWLACTYHLI